MPLTATKLSNLRPKEKDFKVYDSQGLFVIVGANGKIGWRFKYRYDDKERLISLGTYPEIDLVTAREQREANRKLVASGIDPSNHRKAKKAARIAEVENTFEVVALEWLAKNERTWKASHTDKIRRRLENDIFPWIGKKPISELTPPDILSVLRRIEKRGVIETAHRALQNCGQIFRYGVATGRVTQDVTRDLRGALPPVQGGHFAAITEPSAIGRLMRAISTYNGSPVTMCALKLAPLVFVRPGELRGAEWNEFDLNNGVWQIPATRMKLGLPHIVPLARQAVKFLRELQPITGDGRLVFPGIRSKERCISDNTILAALRQMGFPKDEMSGHGFRAMARTVLDEVLNIRPDYIEHQLAHNVKDPLGRAYNRTAHLKERTEMMQLWADYLDKITHEPLQATP